MGRRRVVIQDPEGILTENILDLRCATDRAYQLFSEVMLLRGAIDFARAREVPGSVVLDHCRRALMRSSRFWMYTNRILRRLKGHLETASSEEVRAFCDALEHMLTGLTDAVEVRIVAKIKDVQARVWATEVRVPAGTCESAQATARKRAETALKQSVKQFQHLVFAEGKDSLFCTASALVEQADQIRRQIPKDWTTVAIMQHADRAHVNGNGVGSARAVLPQEATVN